MHREEHGEVHTNLLCARIYVNGNPLTSFFPFCKIVGNFVILQDLFGMALFRVCVIVLGKACFGKVMALTKMT